jgi:hypothetical protein
MGLLDMLGSDNGLLGLHLMAAGSAKPVRTGFGEGLLGALQGVQAQRQAEKDRAMKERMQLAQLGLLGAQMDETKAQAAQREAQAAKSGGLQELLQGIIGGQSVPSQHGLAGGGINLGGVQEPMRPRPAGLAGATPEQMLALKAAGIDGRELWQDAQRGLEVKPGSFYQKGDRREYIGDPTKGIGMEGGRVVLMPGAQDAQAALAGATKTAEAQANASFDPVRGIMPDGSEGIVGSRKSVLEQFNQPRQLQPPQLPAIDRVRAAMARNGDAAANFDIGGVRGSIGGTTGGGIKTGYSPTEKARVETIGLGNQSFMKDRYAPALEAGDAATQTIAATQAARSALAGLGKSGWGTPMIAGAASVLGALGVPQAEKFASNAQMFQSAAMGRLWTTLNAAKGPQTEGDAERASKTFAQLENTPRANEFILDMTHATAERERLKAQYFREALPMAQESGDLQEIERRWARIAPSVFTLPMMKRWAQ